jgi:hypothetical protein
MKYFSVVLLLFVTLLEASPSWYRNPGTIFNTSTYLIGSGSGSSFEQASDIAKSMLIQQISVDVSSRGSAFLEEIRTESGGNFREVTTLDVTTVSEHRLAGMELRQHEENGVYFVVVAQSIPRMLQVYEIEMNDILNRLQNENNVVERLKAEGQIVGALRVYDEIHRLLSDFYMNKFIFNVFSNRPFQNNPALSPLEINRRVDELLRSIRFSVVSGDRQSARRGDRLANPIVFRLFVGDHIGVLGLPVRLVYGNDETITVGALNHNGEITVSAVARDYQGSAGNVFVRLSSESFPSIDSGSLQFNLAEAHYTARVDGQIATGRTAIHLFITDENGNRHTAVEGRLGQIIAGGRYEQGGTGSPVFWRGIVTTNTYRSGNTFFVTASVNIQVGVTQTDDVVGSLNAIGTGQSTQSEAHARALAIQNIDISNREITFVMRRAEDRLSR